jgi:Ser/Thr protein kinase RdoA (MazF antagonist)
VTPPRGTAELARRALERYDLAQPVTIDFLRHGENTTFRVDATDGSAFALRLHRPGYQTSRSIRSEVAWMESLRATGLATASAVRGRDGEVVQELQVEGGTRLVAVFMWVDGVPLTQIDRLDLWGRLGELMATVQRHGARWRRPDGFTRHAWDVAGMVGPEPHMGDPLRLASWTPEEEGLLLASRDVVRERLTRFGQTPDRYGLIHADLGVENVLVQPDGTTILLDFDDGGFGWYVYELAVALFPFDGEAGFEARRDALVGGYRAAGDLPDAMLAELPTFLMARRLVTLGWTFSHAETAHAQRQREWRLRTMPDAARRFLAWHDQQSR